MAKIHLILGSKGGIGKSLLAYFMAQYIIEKNGALIGFDTDLHNKTFASYPALKARPLDLVDEETMKVKPKAFDLVYTAIDAMPTCDVVIDIGASSFQPFAQYQLEMDLIGTWVDSGHEVIVHCVLAGGKSFRDTLVTYDTTMTSFQFGKGAKCIVWANAIEGPLELKGVDLFDLEQYTRHSKNVYTHATFPLIEGLFKDALVKMTSECLTFWEVLEAANFDAAEKARSKRIRTWIYNVFDGIDCMLGGAPAAPAEALQMAEVPADSPKKAGKKQGA